MRRTRTILRGLPRHREPGGGTVESEAVDSHAKEQIMSESTTVEQRWVAFGPAGALGTIHRTAEGFQMKLLDDNEYRGSYPTLEIAKSALFAVLEPGSDWPEFREH
jgi:hypothetical protein